MVDHEDQMLVAKHRNDVKDDFDERLHAKKKMTLGLRLGRHKAHEHLKQAEEELTQMQPAPLVCDDHTM
ncbi:MAG: hypothetical protein J5580_02335 [Clostridia bacterium]|nr:hypothetical protein [Clostridia bacterium]